MRTWEETEAYSRGFDDGRAVESDMALATIKNLRWQLERARHWELLLALVLIVVLATGAAMWTMRATWAKESGAGTPPAAPLSMNSEVKGSTYAV